MKIAHYLFLFIFIFRNHLIYEFGNFETFALATIVFPIYLYSAAKMLDSISFYLQTMLSRFLYFVYPKNILKLKSQRETLAKEVLQFVDIHIKDADPKYDEERILFKKEADRGDSEKDIFVRRNSMRKSKQYLIDEVKNILSSE